MNKYFLLFFSLLMEGCGTSCPPVLQPNFCGPGFLISHRTTNSPVIFFPTCSINSPDILTSLQDKNLGNGVVIDLSHLDLFNLKGSEPAVVNSPLVNGGREGYYLLPVWLTYHGMTNKSDCPTCSVKFGSGKNSFYKKYSYSIPEIDTVYYLR